MDLGLNGKVAIVTGGSDGIGRAAATRFSEEGAKVAIVSRTASDLETVATELSAATGNEVMSAPADVSDEAAVKSAVNSVVARFGGIDILVNNAGTSSAAKFEDMTNEQLDIDFTLKVKGAIYVTRYALPHLKQSSAGAICMTTTPGGKVAAPGTQPTALSRAAGISLMKAWSKEFAEFGIRVNTVCVGVLKSRQHRRRWEAMHANNPDYSLDDHWATVGGAVPLGRIGEAHEAGDVIVFVCSERASYVSGTAINVDGGTAPVY